MVDRHTGAMVTAAAASALQAADEDKRRRDEAIRLQSDTAVVDEARRDRLDKLPAGI